MTETEKDKAEFCRKLLAIYRTLIDRVDDIDAAVPEKPVSGSDLVERASILGEAKGRLDAARMIHELIGEYQ